MTRVLFFLLIPVRCLFTRMGIDFSKMEYIVSYKILIDSRKSKKVQNSSNTGKEVNRSQLKTGLYLMFSMAFLFYMISSRFDLSGTLLVFHALLLLMMTVTVLNEYGDTVFDMTDNSILSRMPVDSRTVWFSRMLVLVYYFLFFGMCLIFVPLLVVTIREGFVHGLLLFAASLLNIFFSLLFVNLLYLILLRFLSPEKFQQITGYFRIAFVILLAMSYIFLNQLSFRGEINLEYSWISYFPASWFAAFNEYYMYKDVVFLNRILVGVCISIISAFISVKWFAPYFAKKVNQLDISTFYDMKEVKRKHYVGNFLSNILTLKPMSRIGFDFVWKLSSGNRYYMEITLPMVMLTLVYNIFNIYFVNSNGTASISSGISIFGLYFTFFAAFMIVDNMQYVKTGNFYSFFSSKPIEKPGMFLLGGFKAIYLKMFVPIYFIICVITICFSGMNNILNFIFPFLVITCLSMVIFFLKSPALPFSHERKKLETGMYFLWTMAVTFVGIFFAFIHVLLSKFSHGLLIGSITGVVVTIVLGHLFSRTSWKRIESTYDKKI